MQHALVGITVTAALAAVGARAEPTVDRNIVYGMHSGLALLMDVHHPERPNGHSIVHVSGSAWHAPLDYDAAPLKESQIRFWGPTLLRAGYTVFTINHRAAPRFRHPAALEDVQRAVRFVRHNARRFGVDPVRVGGIGGSSGAHLLGLVAMLRSPGIAGDPDPVNREDATLQAVVLRACPFDLVSMPEREVLPSFMGRVRRDAADLKVYAGASPIMHVSPGAPPVLLLHGDADEVVPYDQSVTMEKVLRAANVAVKLVRIPGGEHGEGFGVEGQRPPTWPDYLAETVSWFDQYLKPLTR